MRFFLAGLAYAFTACICTLAIYVINLTGLWSGIPTGDSAGQIIKRLMLALILFLSVSLVVAFPAVAMWRSRTSRAARLLTILVAAAIQVLSYSVAFWFAIDPRILAQYGLLWVILGACAYAVLSALYPFRPRVWTGIPSHVPEKTR